MKVSGGADMLCRPQRNGSVEEEFNVSSSNEVVSDMDHIPSGC